MSYPCFRFQRLEVVWHVFILKHALHFFSKDFQAFRSAPELSSSLQNDMNRRTAGIIDSQIPSSLLPSRGRSLKGRAFKTSGKTSSHDETRKHNCFVTKVRRGNRTSSDLLGRFANNTSRRKAELLEVNRQFETIWCISDSAQSVDFSKDFQRREELKMTERRRSDVSVRVKRSEQWLRAEHRLALLHSKLYRAAPLLTEGCCGERRRKFAGEEISNGGSPSSTTTTPPPPAITTSTPMITNPDDGKQRAPLCRAEPCLLRETVLYEPVSHSAWISKSQCSKPREL